MADANDFNDANVGEDVARPADNMVPTYDPFVDPGTKVGPEVDPKAEDGHDDDADDGEEVRPAASMSMTKAELLDRLHEHEDGLTKAQILDRIKGYEDGDGDAGAFPDPTPAAAPADTATRTATVDGRTLSWTAATEDQVPQTYRDVYAQSKSAGG